MKQIHLDFSALDTWHRAEVRARLGCDRLASEAVRLVEDPTQADYLLRFGGHALGDRLPADRPEGPRVFVWSDSDRPSGFEPGLYCSLPRRLFDARRHRTTCYPIQYNECVDRFDPGDARRLFSFVGGITSGLRARLVDFLSRNPGEGECRVSGAPWQAMFDRSGQEVKRTYADSLRRAKFILCPRGNGVGSIRMFEAMQAGRVPVILSDAYVLPSEVDWDACALRVREKDLPLLPARLKEHEARWESLARNARAEWERHYAPGAVLENTVRALEALAAPPPPRVVRIRLASVAFALRRRLAALASRSTAAVRLRG